MCCDTVNDLQPEFVRSDIYPVHYEIHVEIYLVRIRGKGKLTLDYNENGCDAKSLKVSCILKNISSIKQIKAEWEYKYLIIIRENACPQPSLRSKSIESMLLLFECLTHISSSDNFDWCHCIIYCIIYRKSFEKKWMEYQVSTYLLSICTRNVYCKIFVYALHVDIEKKIDRNKKENRVWVWMELKINRKIILTDISPFRILKLFIQKW